MRPLTPCVPAPQFVHEVAEAALQVPSPQPVQLAEPAAEKKPAAQGVHALAEELRWLVVSESTPWLPAGQGVQSASPALAYVPSGQIEQETEALTLCGAVKPLVPSMPSPQGVQAFEPEGAHEPSGHVVQLKQGEHCAGSTPEVGQVVQSASPAFEYEPRPQVLQAMAELMRWSAVRPFVPSLPAAQFVQVEAAVDDHLPSRQSPQFGEPAMPLKVPALQLLQAAWALTL